ncbi:MAG: hypothetical protein AB1690_08990 [Candidatus Zixiibacteriota bacterium]|jgi:hypothetical protein
MSGRASAVFHYGSLLIALAVVGILWRNHDRRSIINLNYRTASYPVMKEEISDSGQFLVKVKDGLSKQGFLIVEERQPQPSVWEIIAQSSDGWLLATHQKKVTIIDAVTRVRGDSLATERGYLVFEGFHKTGSRFFICVVFFSLTVAVSFKVSKEMLPPVTPRIFHK